jgi:hypothetical protein
MNSLVNNKTQESKFKTNKNMKPHKMCKWKTMKRHKNYKVEKHNVMKSQITFGDLRSHNKGLYPKHAKTWTYSHLN